MIVISLPKDKNQISNSYRLTQNEDKKAEIDIKIKITSIFEGRTELSFEYKSKIKGKLGSFYSC